MKLKKKKGRDVSIPTSSMSDIAFLLLIFFLVTTHFDTEKGLALRLPPFVTDEVTQVRVKQENVMKVEIASNDAIAIDGEQVNVKQVSDIVKQRLKENDKLSISFQTNRLAKYNTMIAVLDELKKAKATRISLSTK